MTTDIDTADGEVTFLELKLVLDELTVVLADAKTGVKTKYVLSELDGTKRDLYFSNMSNRVKTKADGTTGGISSFNGMFADLLVLCMRNADTDKQVTIGEVQSWPAKTSERLYKEAQKLSGLDAEEAKKEAKND